MHGAMYVPNVQICTTRFPTIESMHVMTCCGMRIPSLAKIRSEISAIQPM
jgi:hypothetical protein